MVNYVFSSTGSKKFLHESEEHAENALNDAQKRLTRRMSRRMSSKDDHWGVRAKRTSYIGTFAQEVIPISCRNKYQELVTFRLYQKSSTPARSHICVCPRYDFHNCECDDINVSSTPIESVVSIAPIESCHISVTHNITSLVFSRQYFHWSSGTDWPMKILQHRSSRARGTSGEKEEECHWHPKNWWRATQIDFCASHGKSKKSYASPSDRASWS